MKFLVYILRTSKNTLYTGQTNNLEKRMLEHKNRNYKSAKYLRMFESFKIELVEEYATRSEALKREISLKKYNKAQKEYLIKKMKNKKYLPHTWYRDGLFAAESKIDNKGVFTKIPIKKGETVMIFGGKLYQENELDVKKHRLISMFPIDDYIYIGQPADDTSENIDDYLNHSCDANTWLTDEVTIDANRDIAKNEEITLDCATWDADQIDQYSETGECFCQSKNCRKKLSHDDWKKPDIQIKYANHFAPYIQRKIDNLNKSKHEKYNH